MLHTPTPWHLDEEDEPCIRSDTGDMVARTYVGTDFPCLDDEERDEADELAMVNAAFIVQAVNTHDALVAALDRLTGSMLLHEGRDIAGRDLGTWDAEALIAARAALKLAKS